MQDGELRHSMIIIIIVIEGIEEKKMGEGAREGMKERRERERERGRERERERERDSDLNKSFSQSN